MRISTLFVVGLLLAGPVSGESIAVVVNPQSPIQNLTAKELKAAYEGYGLPGVAEDVTLVYLRGKTEDAFNQGVLGISSKKVKVYWLKRVFEGESDMRKICKTVAQVKAFIGENEGCIGFIPAPELDDSVRAITIDAKTHDDPGYQLK